jgi:hypothetical protein
VHAGFDHANMIHSESETSTTFSDDDSLCDINGRKHAGFGHANMPNNEANERSNDFEPFYLGNVEGPPIMMQMLTDGVIP